MTCQFSAVYLKGTCKALLPKGTNTKDRTVNNFFHLIYLNLINTKKKYTIFTFLQLTFYITLNLSHTNASLFT